MNKLALIALLPVSFVLAADPADRAAGHWEAKSNGATIALDLVRDAAGAWNGGLHGGAPGAVPLKNIFVAGHSVHFETPGGGFAPTFDGRLSEDGQTLTGSAKHDTELDRLTFHRTGEAHVAGLPERSTPITKALEGEWLADQGDMHLILRLANGSDGIGGGMLVAPEEGNREVAASRVAQYGAQVVLDVPMIPISFRGELNKAGTEISGTWTIRSNTFPIVLTRKSAS